MKNSLKIIIPAIVFIFLLAPVMSKAAPHSVSTQPAQDVTDRSAVLRGYAVPDSSRPTTAYFRYSQMPAPPIFCNEIYGVNMVGTPDISLPSAGYFSQFVGCLPNETIDCLEPDTTYYYCAVASTKNDIVHSFNTLAMSFTTLPCPTCDPTSVKTKEPTGITNKFALLNGFINTTKASQGWFEYRQSSVAVNQAEAVGVWKSTPKQNFPAKVSLPMYFSLSGLSPNTQYDYRAVAQRTDGGPILHGDTISFKTRTTAVGSTDPCDPNTPLPPVGPSADAETAPSGGRTIGQQFNINIPFVFTPRTVGGSIPISIPISFTSLGNPCPPENPDPRPMGPGLPPVGVTPTPDIPTAPGELPTTPAGITIDAIVRFEEGVEHVFVRQIVGIPAIAKAYGYAPSQDLQKFAEDLAHRLAKLFGYIDEKDREVRVLPPDIAAYELKFGPDGLLMVNEYFGNLLIGTRKIKDSFKTPAHSYEYYYQPR